MVEVVVDTEAVDTEAVDTVVVAVGIIKQLPSALNVDKFIEMPNLSSTVMSTMMMLIMVTFNCDLYLGM